MATPDPHDLPPTATPVEIERAQLDAVSEEPSRLDPVNGSGIVAGGALAIVLAIVAVWLVAPLGPVVLPLLVAAMGGLAVGAAIAARRPRQAREEFARLRERARLERPTPAPK